MIRVENLIAGYGDHVILRDISVKVEKGEIFSVVGRSGSGKSTFLKCLIGFIRPIAGRIFIEEDEISRMPEARMNRVRRKMGMVFQRAALLDYLDVYHNVAFGLRYNGKMKGPEIRERVTEVLDAVELEGMENRMPAELSGGQQKRVSLARALAERPGIILYDEPTTGLDPVITENINRLILKTRDLYGVTSIIISHDIKSVLRFSDRIASLFKGEFTDIGSTSEIMKTEDPELRAFLDTLEVRTRG